MPSNHFGIGCFYHIQKFNYDIDRIKLIQQCIRNHRGSVLNSKITIEELCVADADAIANPILTDTDITVIDPFTLRECAVHVGITKLVYIEFSCLAAINADGKALNIFFCR